MCEKFIYRDDFGNGYCLFFDFITDQQTELQCNQFDNSRQKTENYKSKTIEQ